MLRRRRPLTDGELVASTVSFVAGALLTTLVILVVGHVDARQKRPTPTTQE